MTRFQRLAAITLVTTLALVAIGVAVRATDSGLACPTWPGCFEGQFLPRLDDGFNVWIEWIHRTVAVLIGLLIIGMAFLALRDHGRQRSLVWPSIAAVLLVGFQGWLGRETVLLGNSGESVTAHLAAAMALVGLLTYLVVRAAAPARRTIRPGSQRFTLLASFAAASIFALLMFGSHVTAQNAALVFLDWPLMGGALFPALDGVAVTAHILHRWIGVVVGLIVAAVVIVALRTQRENGLIVRLAWFVGILYPIQAVVGGLQVLTLLDEWTQVLHVAFGALIWTGAVAIAVASYYSVGAPGLAESIRAAPSAAAPAEGDPTRSTPATPFLAAPDAPDAPDAPTPASKDPSPRSRNESVRAYIALTKPRIIELLLVTTVPAMVLATREVPGIELGHWAWLTVWTLVCGTLAAGSANAINQYLERDIDQLMNRTRRRPLPTQAVAPDRAMVFGIVLGAISIAAMAFLVNLLAAFLTLLAIAFYVVVYTMILKRTTPQNIVIGGAAGALPPVIGWAAVTGSVGLPAVLLFAIVFYWTPPHFWALSLRIRKDYAAAGVPMLPVVRGIPETARQIGLYTILLVAISFVFAAVAQMGLVYLVAAAILGAVFLWQAYRLWRVADSEEGSTAGAIRLYRYSISYLTLLFGAIALDVIVLVPVG